MRTIDIVFDDESKQTLHKEPPKMVFVEVESPPGTSIKFGEWVHREDGYDVLRFRHADATEARILRTYLRYAMALLSSEDAEIFVRRTGVCDGNHGGEECRDAECWLKYFRGETFVDVSTGLTMELGKWYVITDSGQAVTRVGFESSALAVHWCTSTRRIPVLIPEYKGPVEGWPEMDAINVIKADHLKEWWEAHNV